MPTALVNDIHFCGDKVNESFKVYHKPRNSIVLRDLSQLLIIIQASVRFLYFAISVKGK